MEVRLPTVAWSEDNKILPGILIMTQAVSTGFVKYNGPRQLRDDEKLQDLNHWRDLFISYYKRDKA